LDVEVKIYINVLFHERIKFPINKKGEEIKEEEIKKLEL
jgi:hypothetical protein